jgi:uncharacterized membrane protein YkvA (DUF1232 family)
MNTDDYSNDYSDDGFWKKILGHMKSAGRQVTSTALTLYYCGVDPETPPRARLIIFSALGYLINPFDAIPDMTPIVGYADDLGALILALHTVAISIKPEHHNSARDKTSEWFGAEEQPES